MVKSVTQAIHVALLALLLAVMLPCVPARAAANGNVVVTVDTAHVQAGESFVLTFEADSVVGDPDFAPLQADFDILGTSQRTNINIVNGRMQKSTMWQLKLIAKRAGEIPIPSIAFGSTHSEALTLTVGGGGAAPAQTNDTSIRIEVSATPERPYVQQQVVLTVRVVVPEQLDLVDSATGDPHVSGGDALITLLGKPRERMTNDGGTRARVIERTYALFPQQHGDLTIDPISFEGQIFEGAATLDDPFSQSIRTVRLKSDPIRLSVKPIPATFKGRHWLPAASVELVENWSDDPAVLKAGEPITRSISLLARGVTAGQLPELDPINDPKVRSYPEQPALDDQGRSDGVIGLRMEKYALIAQANGEITLPAIRVPWWNTKLDRLEEAVIPARTLKVEGGVAPAKPPAAAANPAPAPSSTQSPPVTSAAAQPDGRWSIVAAILAVGWAATVIAWWLTTRARRPVRTPSIPAPGEDKAAAAARVVAAARRGDALDTRRALLAWARAVGIQPASLETIGMRFPGLAPALTALDRQLYAGQPDERWRGEELAAGFMAAQSMTDAPRTVPRTGLKPLHPEATA